MSDPHRAAHAARLTALAGLANGLGAAPLAGLGPPPVEALLVLATLATCMALARPPGVARFPQLAWTTGVGLVALAAGLAAGSARTAAIDAGAVTAPAGERVAVRGLVEAVPRRSDGEVRVRVATAEGRVLVAAPEPVGELRVGHEVEARGVLREPQPWESGFLARLGIARILHARAIEPTGRRRDGLGYLTDRLRERAEVALSHGTPEAEAALLRGFVLGEDDRIDPGTVADFQASGLAHLLAVSGQNVLLLALLAASLLGVLGVPLRARLVCILALIAVYVPMAGAGASIQRAGVMGAAGVVAALAGRPAARWYAMALAAAVTLALNPRAVGDVGWQLSFAAVAGIALWTAPLRNLLAGGGPAGRTRRALAEAAAITVAATVATAPLMAHHFERISPAALPANLVALPAVAPVMWLGMLAAAAGQLSWLPAEPLTGLAGLCAAFIAQVAHWFAAPAWAQVDAPLAEPWALAATYAVLLAGAWMLVRRRGARAALRPRAARRRGLVVAGVLLVALGGGVLLGGSGSSPPPAALRVTVLDVGQGDAILLEPRRGHPILVDTGPAGSGVAERLDELGVERLAAVVVTHEDSDHAGELGELLSRVEVRTLAHGAPAPRLERIAEAAGADPVQVGEGSSLSSGPLRLDVLWPPRALLDGPAPEQPNLLSVVIRARWRDFELLLTGDGEAEAVPLDPGPVDVLKVAHHGSEDEGLDRLLEQTAPRVALISVGEGNPYGHPAPPTLAALDEHGVPVLRTDTSGELRIDVTAGGWRVGTEH